MIFKRFLDSPASYHMQNVNLIKLLKTFALSTFVLERFDIFPFVSSVWLSSLIAITWLRINKTRHTSGMRKFPNNSWNTYFWMSHVLIKWYLFTGTCPCFTCMYVNVSPRWQRQIVSDKFYTENAFDPRELGICENIFHGKCIKITDRTLSFSKSKRICRKYLFLLRKLTW